MLFNNQYFTQTVCSWRHNHNLHFMSPVCLCFSFGNTLETFIGIGSQGKYIKWKMPPVPVRRRCVVCETQRFKGEFVRACVRKMKGNDERLEEREREKTETAKLGENE